MTVPRTLAAALIAASLLIQTPSPVVLAQSAATRARFEWGAMGLAPGQTLRAAISNVAGGETIRASAVLLDAQGRVLAQSVQASIGPGAFRSFDFPREALAAAGEPTTGRLQVRLSVAIDAASARPSDAMLELTRGLAPTLELIDATTGRTAASGMIGDTRTVISAEAY